MVLLSSLFLTMLHSIGPFTFLCLLFFHLCFILGYLSPCLLLYTTPFRSLSFFILPYIIPTFIHSASAISYLSSPYFRLFLPFFTLLHLFSPTFHPSPPWSYHPSPASPCSYLLQVAHPLFTCFTQFLSLSTLLHCFLPTSPHPYLSPLHPAPLPLSTLFLPASTFSTSLHLVHFLSLFILLHPLLTCFNLFCPISTSLHSASPSSTCFTLSLPLFILLHPLPTCFTLSLSLFILPYPLPNCFNLLHPIPISLHSASPSPYLS